MTEGMVAAITFNTSHQTSWLYLYGEDPLNSAALATTTHKGFGKVFDGTSTQVVAWMINKWRANII